MSARRSSAQPDALPRTAFTVPEVARSIGLSERQVRRLVERGEIQAKLLGGRVLIPAAVFERLLEDAPDVAE